MEIKELKRGIAFINDHCPSELGYRENTGIGHCIEGNCLQCWYDALDMDDYYGEDEDTGLFKDGYTK